MKQCWGNIWDLRESHWLVIPTNAGWNAAGRNVMGRGLARQAAARYPVLPWLYGKVCRDTAYSQTPDESFAPMPFMVWSPDESPGLILFVTKPVNKDAPQLSWQRKSDLGAIRASCEMLAQWLKLPPELGTLIAMPLVGCGNGGLQESEVLPVLNEFFAETDNVVLVRERER